MFDDEETVKSKVLQIVSSRIQYNTLKNYGINISRPMYDYSRQLVKKNQGISLKESEVTKGPPSTFNDPVITKHVYNFGLNFSDYMHQNILIKKSKKCGHDFSKNV